MQVLIHTCRYRIVTGFHRYCQVPIQIQGHMPNTAYFSIPSMAHLLEYKWDSLHIFQLLH